VTFAVEREFMKTGQKNNLGVFGRHSGHTDRFRYHAEAKAKLE
jgi:hypothetical protein